MSTREFFALLGWPWLLMDLSGSEVRAPRRQQPATAPQRTARPAAVMSSVAGWMYPGHR